MKRIYTLLTFMSMSLFSLMAQTINGSDIQINKPSVSISENMLLVGMDITIPAEMKISSVTLLRARSRCTGRCPCCDRSA